MNSTSERLAFCTLGMFIIDKIEHLNSTQVTQENILGGAGTYAALGARLAAGKRNAHLVSWIVDMGWDFLLPARQLIDTWRTDCVFRLDESRLTTAAWNGYGENEFRAFKYLTPKLRLDEKDLSERQVLASSFHMVCSPARCINLVTGILQRRRDLLRSQGVHSDRAHDEDESRPVFVWEPVPDLCTPEELSRMREAAAYVDVVSPNSEEFASFFTDMAGLESRESQAQWLLGPRSQHGAEEVASRKPMLVIREGAHGCTTYTSCASKSLHLRAQHQNARKVVDPTGGGNTFLGALAIGLTGTTTPSHEIFGVWDIADDQKGLLLALIHATVTAGYAIEQIGMPNVSSLDGDSWNGEGYVERFIDYLDRERVHIVSQISGFQIAP